MEKNWFCDARVLKMKLENNFRQEIGNTRQILDAWSLFRYVGT